MHPYERELEERQKQYAEHLAKLSPIVVVTNPRTMALAGASEAELKAGRMRVDLAVWEHAMEQKHRQDRCRMHQAGNPKTILADPVTRAQDVYDLSRFAPTWLTALAIGRYGEAIDHWIKTFIAWTEADVHRAFEWLHQAKGFEGVAYLEPWPE